MAHTTNIFADQFGYALPQHVCEVSYQVFTCECGLFGTSRLIPICLIMSLLIRDVCHWPAYCGWCALARNTQQNFLAEFLLAILTLRTWAVCGKSKLSTYGLSGVYGLLLTSTIILAALYLRVSTCRYTLLPANELGQLIHCSHSQRFTRSSVVWMHTW